MRKTLPRIGRGADCLRPGVLEPPVQLSKSVPPSRQNARLPDGQLDHGRVAPFLLGQKMLGRAGRHQPGLQVERARQPAAQDVAR